MKKAKTVQDFKFKELSNQEFVNLINKDKPISLKYNEDLVNRVHNRYPFINKADVANIIKATFQSFRDLILLGKILNFNNLFFDTKLLIFKFNKNNKVSTAMKIHISTPPPLKK